jgi:hypothetical protein
MISERALGGGHPVKPRSSDATERNLPYQAPAQEKRRRALVRSNSLPLRLTSILRVATGFEQVAAARVDSQNGSRVSNRRIPVSPSTKRRLNATFGQILRFRYPSKFVLRLENVTFLQLRPNDCIQMAETGQVWRAGPIGAFV